MANKQRLEDCRLKRIPEEPKAAPGCSTCLGICVRRDNARSAGDFSAVSDANVELRRHRAAAHAS